MERSLEMVYEEVTTDTLLVKILEKLERQERKLEEQSKQLEIQNQKLDQLSQINQKLDTQNQKLDHITEVFDMLMEDYFKYLLNTAKRFNEMIDSINSGEANVPIETLKERLSLVKDTVNLANQQVVSLSSEEWQDFYNDEIPKIYQAIHNVEENLEKHTADGFMQLAKLVGRTSGETTNDIIRAINNLYRELQNVSHNINAKIDSSSREVIRNTGSSRNTYKN